MKTATGLALVAIGAILAFAVTAHPSFFNIQVAGWVIMATGVVGLLVPRRGYGWLRRRVVLSRDQDGRLVRRVREQRYPPYVMLNPASPESDMADGSPSLTPAAPPDAPLDAPLATGTPVTPEAVIPEAATPDPGVPPAPGETTAPARETVEEYFPE